MLKAKLYELELRKRTRRSRRWRTRKTDIGWGHQIRSYVLDQSRIKDLRTNLEVGNTQAVLDGDLDDFIDAQPQARRHLTMDAKDDTRIPRPRPPQDENQIIAERRAKLARLREKGEPSPTTSRASTWRRTCTPPTARPPRRTSRPRAPRACVAGRMMLKRLMGKAVFATLQDMSGRIQVYVKARRPRRRGLRGLQALGPGRHRRRRGDALPHEDGRAHDPGELDPAAGEVAAPAAGQVPRARGHGGALPQPPRRPHREPGVARHLHQALEAGAVDPRVLRGARLPRGRDAHAASHPRGRGGQAVHDAPQRARHGHVPAHRAGALPQAAHGGRAGEGLRDQPQLQERGDQHAPQPRVHDDRVLRGLPGLQLPDGPHRGAAARMRAEGRGHDDPRLPGRDDRPRAPLRPAHHGRGDRQVQPEVRPRRAREARVPQGRARPLRGRGVPDRRRGRCCS